eukprot:g2355.t1
MNDKKNIDEEEVEPQKEFSYMSIGNTVYPRDELQSSERLPTCVWGVAAISSTEKGFFAWQDMKNSTLRFWSRVLSLESLAKMGRNTSALAKKSQENVSKICDYASRSFSKEGGEKDP